MPQSIDRIERVLSDRYAIDREVGRGGLSTVYIARDLKHGRAVAVKVLRPSTTSAIPVARFHREIAIAASLHHPHVLPVFDSGEADGLLYFTMPFVEGGSLRERIEGASRLSVTESLRIARQVASALSYAHARRVIHRDVKPDNILMSDGVPQVADFGIARIALEEMSDRLTETGLMVGTPAYMSPEHWGGDGTVDERSDLYSLACVLFEMLVGEPPYGGPTAHVVMARHAVSPIPSVVSLRPDVPEALARFVSQALAKSAADRQPSLAAFAAQLAEVEAELSATGIGLAVGGPARAAPLRKADRNRVGIVVLPFLQLSDSGDYIAHGLGEEIITSLSRLEGLRVLSQTAALQLRGTSKTPRELGRELDIQYVLEGSIRREEECLRVSVRLVSTETEALVWGHGYEGHVTGLFSLEREISRAVVDALAVRVTENEDRRTNPHRPDDPRALEYYLRAKSEIYKFTGDALDRAVEYLEKGAAICGDNVTIWAAMGQVYWQYVNAGIASDPSYLDEARRCADRILAIDPDSPEARRLLGLIEVNARGNPQVGTDHLRAALEANPNDPEALLWLAILYGFVGRPSSGYALAIRLLDIDPLTPLHHLVPGFLDVLDGDPERGLPWLGRAHELEPGNPIIAIAFGQALAMSGEDDEACRILATPAEHAPGSFFAAMGELFSDSVRGRRDHARRLLTPDLLEAVRQDLQYSWTLAQCHAMLGQPEEACSWVENAVRHGFWNYPLLADRDSLLRPLREHGPYQSVLELAKSRWLSFRS